MSCQNTENQKTFQQKTDKKFKIFIVVFSVISQRLINKLSVDKQTNIYSLWTNN